MSAAHVQHSLDEMYRDGSGDRGDEPPTPIRTIRPSSERRSEAEAVRELVSLLPDDARECIELPFGLNGYGGREHKRDEVAAVVGITVGAVYELHASGMTRLREAATGRQLGSQA